MKDMFRLDGKKAVVVGGAGGIGQQIARGLAEFGAQVMISSRSEESLKRAQAEIKEACGADILYYAADASKEESIVALKDEAVKEMGKVDILVCSQGFNRKHPVTEFDMNDWDAMFATNVRGVFLCNKIFGKLMKENGYGKIVDVTSVRALIATFPGGGNAGYCATKGALNMIIRQCATELAPEVTVNGIGPTVTLTPMMEKIVPKEAVEGSIPADHPMGRMAKPEDCVGAAIYLCSEASAYCTGQIIYPDGGLTCKG
jgi:gluconate 5-dehydrogenase